MIDTKDKILDSAERLFARQGYSATSLRHIINDAGVNLAAIHYHFGSKEGLLDRLIERRIGPVNEARLTMLNRFQAEANGAPPSLEKVLEAFLIPTIEVRSSHPELGALMGRLHGEGATRNIAQRHFRDVFARFLNAFRQALPGLPEPELFWRLHFTIGATGFTLIHTPTFAPELEDEPWRGRIERLTAFLSGGLRAPVSSAQEVEAVK